MKWDNLAEEQCSIARASTALGDRWILVILSDCFLGVRIFEDFRARLEISRTTLASRLATLVEHGILKKVPYQTKPTRYEYRLTEKGLALYPAILALAEWGDQYYSDAMGPPILRKHRRCGHDFVTKICCSKCGETIEASEVEARKRPDHPEYRPVRRGPKADDAED